ncbi:sulfite exporter TauE/SafE family protein [bacterium]|nr:MAG: sulfite exporter TauE/SafE family protein [bacterium]
MMGALTFFLPCGFTITVQALALASGNPLQGALIMGIFALGTAPGLLAIGLSSVKLFGNPKVAKQFSIVAGVMVLAFAAFNINAQMSVLGVSNIADVLTAATTAGVSDKGRDTSLVPVVSGKQVIRMEASSRGYTPNRFRIRVGQPVRLEVTDVGTSGCTNAIISKLWDGQIPLTIGTTSTKEFTPSKAGVYKFSCWMGMISGTIEVVDSTGSTGTTPSAAPIGSGAKGCGCGGGSGSCGGSK